jgi:hypothetical protein
MEMRRYGIWLVKTGIVSRPAIRLFDPREATLWHASLLAISQIIGGYF